MGPARYLYLALTSWDVCGPELNIELQPKQWIWTHCKDNTAAVQHYIDQNCKFLVFDEKLEMEREFGKFLKSIEKKLQIPAQNVVADR